MRTLSGILLYIYANLPVCLPLCVPSISELYHLPIVIYRLMGRKELTSKLAGPTIVFPLLGDGPQPPSIGFHLFPPNED